MLRTFYRARFLFGYVTYVIGHLVFSSLLVPFLAFAFLPVLRSRLIPLFFQKTLAFFVLGYFRLLGAFRIAEISGADRARAQAPAIYVANHRGRLDGLFILSLIRNVGVVMKASYVRLPMFSSFARYFDFVSVDSSSVNTLNQTIQRCREVLGRHKNLLVFPEGTRAPTARVLPFKDFAFRLSIDTGIPIIPTVVHTDRPVLGKKYGRIAADARFELTVRFLEPMLAEDDEHPDDFAVRVERLIAGQLRELDQGTEWEHLGRRTTG